MESAEIDIVELSVNTVTWRDNKMIKCEECGRAVKFDKYDSNLCEVCFWINRAEMAREKERNRIRQIVTHLSDHAINLNVDQQSYQRAIDDMLNAIDDMDDFCKSLRSSGIDSRIPRKLEVNNANK
jgi:hypothetical protein